MSDPAVLIVEDDILVRHPLAEYLRECGYQVAEASGIEDAKMLIAADEVKVDILLARGSAGFELAGWVKTHAPAVQVVLAGTVERAAAKAGDLCEDGPAEQRPYEHKFVLERIKQLRATRDRAERKDG